MIDVPRHSTRVRITFNVDGRDYDIAQIGPEIIMFRDRADLPPCRGRLTIRVDDDERCKSVALPDGVRPGDGFVRIDVEAIDVVTTQSDPEASPGSSR